MLVDSGLQPWLSEWQYTMLTPRLLRTYRSQSPHSRKYSNDVNWKKLKRWLRLKLRTSFWNHEVENYLHTRVEMATDKGTTRCNNIILNWDDFQASSSCSTLWRGPYCFCNKLWDLLLFPSPLCENCGTIIFHYFGCRCEPDSNVWPSTWQWVLLIPQLLRWHPLSCFGFLVSSERLRLLVEFRHWKHRSCEMDETLTPRRIHLHQILKQPFS